MMLVLRAPVEFAGHIGPPNRYHQYIKMREYERLTPTYFRERELFIGFWVDPGARGEQDQGGEE